MRNINSSLLKKLIDFKKNKKKIVLCHGVFDLVHLGHLNISKQAKTYGDVLIVSITKDEFIKKGPGRPVFNQNQRFEYLKSIKLIDEVYMSEGDSASEAIRTIKPNYFIKGAEYINEKQDKSKKIIEEKKLVKNMVEKSNLL